MDTLLVWLLAIYSALALLKPVFFAVLPYGKRRSMLDRSYAGRTSATSRSDPILIVFCLVLVGLLARRGAEPASFLTGLLVGMTLIQVYFHRYSIPLNEAEAPPPPHSPIKTMSYAIQAAPGRAGIELAIIAVLLAWSLWSLLA
ncbi:hypothetical protein ABEG18_22305 [Alsobacter sp. KACC 23698]|uniref:DUF4149 domain-containing protein n=1 Tax=Alsobacter sp. KACC 23698 TaxID=3149229 RepID=A0AAU7JE34_9HYPH